MMSIVNWKTSTLAIAFSLFSWLEVLGQAPGCPNVTAGPDTTLPCGSTCTDLTASFLETGATTSYAVSSIPYSPPFSFTGGTSIFIGVDDQWSGIVNMPFNFCFYGSSYNQLVIGANGLISFNIALANGYCEWSFSAPIPTPGPPAAGIYNNSINGAFHDIDPSITFTGAGNDINFGVLGTAPCRTVVINFYDVPHYSFNCNYLTTTQQIVLYETTNVIEVYIQDKPTCFGWNNGNAVIGIQNGSGTAGLTPLGRNTGNWSASNEAWRFTPDGAPNYQIDWYNSAGFLIGSGNPLNVCPAGTETYVVEATYIDCNNSPIIVIDTTVVSTSGPYISSVTDPSCAVGCDGSATVGITNGVPPFTYVWSPTGGTDSTGINLCAGTNYTVTIIDATANACTIPFFFSSTSLTATIVGANDPSCAGATDGTATSITVGGTPPFTYSWSPSGGTGAVGTGFGGGVMYTITIIDSMGCISSDSLTLTDPSAVVADIITAVNPSCDTSADGSALVLATGGTGSYTYLWSPSGGTGTVEPGLSGGVTYTINVTDSNGCIGTDTITLVTPAPVIAVITSSSDPTCATSSDGTATTTVIGGTGSYTYSWSPAGGSTAVAANLDGGILYTVSVQDSNGCSTSTTVILNTPPPLVATITDSLNPLCASSTDGTATVSVTGGTGIYTYAWSPAGGTDSIATGLSGGVTYSILVVDANSCISSDAITLTTPPLLVATITGSTPPSCFNTSDADATVSAVGGSGNYTYSWTPAGGTGNTGTNLTGGVLYTAIVIDAIGCISTDTITIVAPLAMTSNITGATDPSCNGFSDGSATILVANGVWPYVYIWSPTGGTGTTAAGLSAGITYTVDATDANGCTLSTQVTLTDPPVLAATIAGPSDTCEGFSVTIDVTASGGTPSYAYNWSPSGNAAASNTFTPIIGTTTYDVTITDANGCLFYVAHNILVNPEPTASFTSDIVDGCEPIKVAFTNTSPDAVFSSWDLGNGTGNSNIPFTQDYDSVGSYDVTLTITDINGCTNAIIQPGYVNVYPNPVAEFIASPWTGTIVSPTINFFDQSTYSACWEWQFDTLGIDTTQNPSFTFPSDDTGYYAVQLWVCTQYGCVDSIIHYVRIKGDYIMFVPNTFTPHKSGSLNDDFIPIGFGLDYSRLEFWIFNRWGEQIYYTDSGIPWDGTDHATRGKEQMDVYVWLALYRDEYQTLHQAVGLVTVLR